MVKGLSAAVRVCHTVQLVLLDASCITVGLLGCLALRCSYGKVGVQLAALLDWLQLCHKVPGVNVCSLGECLRRVILLLYVPLHKGFGRRQRLPWTPSYL